MYIIFFFRDMDIPYGSEYEMDYGQFQGNYNQI